MHTQLVDQLVEPWLNCRNPDGAERLVAVAPPVEGLGPASGPRRLVDQGDSAAMVGQQCSQRRTAVTGSYHHHIELVIPRLQRAIPSRRTADSGTGRTGPVS